MINKNIKWISCGVRSLRAELPLARADYSNPGFHMGLRETDMDEVQRWSWETGIGRRMSFDTWQFRSREEITAFLLRWS